MDELAAWATKREEDWTLGEGPDYRFWEDIDRVFALTGDPRIRNDDIVQRNQGLDPIAGLGSLWFPISYKDPSSDGRPTPGRFATCPTAHGRSLAVERVGEDGQHYLGHKLVYGALSTGRQFQACFVQLDTTGARIQSGTPPALTKAGAFDAAIADLSQPLILRLAQQEILLACPGTVAGPSSCHKL